MKMDDFKCFGCGHDGEDMIARGGIVNYGQLIDGMQNNEWICLDCLKPIIDAWIREAEEGELGAEGYLEEDES